MLAREHGFEPATPQWYGRHVSAAQIAGFAAKVSSRRARRSQLVDAYRQDQREKA